MIAAYLLMEDGIILGMVQVLLLHLLMRIRKKLLPLKVQIKWKVVGDFIGSSRNMETNCIEKGLSTLHRNYENKHLYPAHYKLSSWNSTCQFWFIKSLEYCSFWFRKILFILITKKAFNVSKPRFLLLFIRISVPRREKERSPHYKAWSVFQLNFFGNVLIFIMLYRNALWLNWTKSPTICSIFSKSIFP